MTNKINEAAITLDIVDFNSSDFETLAQILHLAGVAEQGEADPAAISQDLGAPAAPGIGDEVPMEPELGMEPDVNIVDTGIDSDLGGDDMGSEDDLTLGVDGSPVLDIADTDEDPELGGFDMDRMRQLSGIQESVEEDEDAEDEEEQIDEGRILPDLTLGEDATEDRDVEFGPFRTEREAVENATEKTNGVEGDNFIVVVHANAFYWKRTIQEDVLLRPEPEDVNTDGVVYSKHEYERVPGTPAGNNGLKNRMNESDEESEECDDEDTVEALHESLNQRFQQYLGK